MLGSLGRVGALQDEACRQMIINCSALEQKVIKKKEKPESVRKKDRNTHEVKKNASLIRQYEICANFQNRLLSHRNVQSLF